MCTLESECNNRLAALIAASEKMKVRTVSWTGSISFSVLSSVSKPKPLCMTASVDNDISDA